MDPVVTFLGSERGEAFLRWVEITHATPSYWHVTPLSSQFAAYPALK